MNLKPLFAVAGVLALVACGKTEQNPELLKGANFVSEATGTNITLSFAPDENRVHGQVVNVYNGSYQAEGDKIKFTPFASTMMMGPANAMQTEQDYFQFMATVETYELDNGRLTLKNADGKEIVFQEVEMVEPAAETAPAAEQPAEAQPAEVAAEPVATPEAPVAAK